jgi:hypothetical protein
MHGQVVYGVFQLVDTKLDWFYKMNGLQGNFWSSLF